MLVRQAAVSNDDGNDKGTPSDTGRTAGDSERKRWWTGHLDQVQQWRHLPLTRFLVCVLCPALALLVCSIIITVDSKRAYETRHERWKQLQMLCFPIGRLVFELTNERDTSVTYMTARQVGERRQQEELWTSLISARQEVNAALDLLPASRRSRTLLLAAMLKRHRSDFKVGQNFIDDMQFYTDVIEMAVDWLNTDCTSCVGVSDSSSQWMTIYGHFLNSVNFLTGEQSLCNAFSSLVCFSNRERLFYVNFTFSGEAAFRLYRRSYPAGHVILTDRWWGRSSDHTSLFPTLAQCRRDVVEDLNYYSLSSDQDQREICDLSRRNETRSHEVSDLLQTEMDTIVTLATTNLQQEVSVASRRYVAIACLLAISVCYCLVISGLNIVDVVHHYVKLKRLRKELELQALCVEDSCCREFHKLGLDRAHACGSLPDDKQDSCVLLSPTTTLTRTRSNYSNGSLGAAMTDCLLRDSNHANIRAKDVSGDIIDCPLTCQIRIATV